MLNLESFRSALSFRKIEKENPQVRVAKDIAVGKTPYSIVLGSQLINELVKETLSYQLRNKDQIIFDTSAPKNEQDEPIYGAMESQRPYEPLVVRVFMGNFYQLYRDLENILDAEKAVVETEKEITSTVMHEISHYVFGQNPFLSYVILIKNPELSHYVEGLKSKGYAFDNDEALCHYIGDSIARDSKLAGCVKFICKQE